MEIIDVKTVFIIYVITNALCAVVMTSLWLHNRKRFPGIALWLFSFIIQFVAMVLILLRGAVPDLFSMVLANTFAVGGTVALYIGLERFLGKQNSQTHNYVMIGVFMLLHAYFTYVYPNLPLRNVNLSLGLLFVFVQASWLMLWRVEPKMRAAARLTGVILAIFCLVSVIRIPSNLARFKDADGASLFQSGIFDAIILITYMVLFIGLTFALFTLVNRRLSIELEDELLEREQAQNSLRESEEKYRSILDNILEGYFETDLKGNIIFANDSACNLLGYDKETLYKINYRQFSTPDTKNKFQEIYGEVLRTGNPSKINDYEIMSDDGVIRINELNVALIRDSAGKPTGFRAVARDITEKKQADALVNIRLSLFEFAATHSLDELLQKTLDEVGPLINSPIGFYHFVEKDQKTLSLQAWSTRTLNEFCKAEGKGLHYGIDQAGVWVDCVSEKRPVIHNDYSSLPHRKGLPPGHAPVIRELVVPIMRAGNVVAILGVGNKPVDYTDKDVEIVSYLADVAWEIAERKRAEERIKQSEENLKEAQHIAQLGNWELDLATNTLNWSDGIYDLFEIDPNKFGASYEAFLNAIHPDDRLMVDRAYTESLKTKAPYEIEHRLLMKDGRIKWVIERCRTEYDIQGNTLKSFGIVQDITMQKQAEEKINKYSSDLKEHMKELNCLYSVSEIVRKEDISQEEILKLSPDIISQAYQFPEITACRITWGDSEYKTENFKKTQWSENFPIMVQGQQVGKVEVCCIGTEHQKCYDNFFLVD